MSSLIGDKGYDGDGFRAEIVNRGAKPVIPNKSNRVTLHSFSKRAYKGRNVIERCFYRLKDVRRVATRCYAVGSNDLIQRRTVQRRECQSIPIDVQAVFHLGTWAPTVLATSNCAPLRLKPLCKMAYELVRKSSRGPLYPSPYFGAPVFS